MILMDIYIPGGWHKSEYGDGISVKIKTDKNCFHRYVINYGHWPGGSLGLMGQIHSFNAIKVLWEISNL